MNPEAVGEHLELLIVVVIRWDDLYKAYLRLRNRATWWWGGFCGEGVSICRLGLIKLAGQHPVIGNKAG